jgi:RsiW-degrading membrane proteinase PrsW (M82 family)
MYRFLPGAGTGQIVPALLTGVAEETGKALVLLFVVSSLRYPWQVNGMLFGAAVGAGFAGFESAGYAYKAGAGLFDSIMLRAILAPGGHVIWTAMVGAAIWRVKGNQKFNLGMLLHPVVLRRLAIAIVLHGLWDSSILAWYIQLPILSIVGWYLILAMLKQAYAGIEQVKESAGMAAAA